MEPEKGKYFNLLTPNNKLKRTTINSIIDHMDKLGLHNSPIDEKLLKKNAEDGKITEYLTRLELRVIEGNKSWEGLLVGFPGNVTELSTKSVGTPYLRSILYPILDLHHRLQKEYNKKLPCIYFVGERFSDVFLRKFDLLRKVVPHIIVLTHDIYACSIKVPRLPVTIKNERFEAWTQMRLSKKMDDGLMISNNVKKLSLRFFSYEVSCNEGTDNPERLDILGYDEPDHRLVAFEIKGRVGQRTDFENLFLQGIEHWNWLEKNKMAVKLLFDKGPKGKVDTTKRVRLLLGFYGENVPHIFNELRRQYEKGDKEYTEIDFIRFTNIQTPNKDYELILDLLPRPEEKSLV